MKTVNCLAIIIMICIINSCSNKADNRIDSIYSYENGIKVSVCPTIKGKKNGWCTYFYENGKIMATSFYNNNVLEKEWRHDSTGRKKHFRSWVTHIDGRTLTQYIDFKEDGKVDISKGSCFYYDYKICRSQNGKDEIILDMYCAPLKKQELVIGDIDSVYNVLPNGRTDTFNLLFGKNVIPVPEHYHQRPLYCILLSSDSATHPETGERMWQSSMSFFTVNKNENCK